MAGRGCGVGATANKDHCMKLVLYFTNYICVDSKENSNLVCKDFVTVETQNTLYGGRNIENLFYSNCFNLKISESTCLFQILIDSTFFAMTIVQNLYQEYTQSGVF